MSLGDVYGCREAFARLEDYVDRELSDHELNRVEAHLRICEMCAHEFSFEARVLEEIRAKLLRLDVPDGLKARLARLLEEERNGG